MCLMSNPILNPTFTQSDVLNVIGLLPRKQVALSVSFLKVYLETIAYLR